MFNRNIMVGKKDEKRNRMENIIKLCVCSDLRRNSIFSLTSGKKSLSELKIILNSSSTTTIHTLKELEKNNLVLKDKDRNYALTNNGKIVSLKLIDFQNVAEVMTQYERFWLDHNIDDIPDHLLEKIGYLKNSYLEKITSSEIIKSHKSLNQFIKSAKSVKLVIPILSNDHMSGIQKIIEKNINTQIICTDFCLKKFIEMIGKETFDKLTFNHDFDIYTTDQKLDLAFLVTNEFFFLGLFSFDSLYDSSQDLNSTDIKAIEWGNELFEYYKGKARKYTSD